jgi:hypothetical protein
LRELREEIGMLRHGNIEELQTLDKLLGQRLFLIRDVEYQPRRSREISEVKEVDVDDLPARPNAQATGLQSRLLAWVKLQRHISDNSVPALPVGRRSSFAETADLSQLERFPFLLMEGPLGSSSEKHDRVRKRVVGPRETPRARQLLMKRTSSV